MKNGNRSVGVGVGVAVGVGVVVGVGVGVAVVVCVGVAVDVCVRVGVRVCVVLAVSVGVTSVVSVDRVSVDVSDGSRVRSVAVTVAVDGCGRGRRGVALRKRDRFAVFVVFGLFVVSVVFSVRVRSVVSTIVELVVLFLFPCVSRPRQPAVAPTSASVVLRRSDRRVVFVLVFGIVPNSIER